MAKNKLKSCKICLVENRDSKETRKIKNCRCVFCKDCLQAYLEIEIMAGKYQISCPDYECPKKMFYGRLFYEVAHVFISMEEIEQITDKELLEKHKKFRLNTEVLLDPKRAWCPKPGCDTICQLGPDFKNLKTSVRTFYRCTNCAEEFCAHCSEGWHEGKFKF